MLSDVLSIVLKNLIQKLGGVAHHNCSLFPHFIVFDVDSLLELLTPHDHNTFHDKTHSIGRFTEAFHVSNI